MYQLSKERMRIARNVRLIRTARNYNQRYVAASLQISRSTLSTWENGIAEITIENLARIAIVLGLDSYRQILDLDPDAIFNIKVN